jgi:YhcH/YjgK/YiaL family protein
MARKRLLATTVGDGQRIELPNGAFAMEQVYEARELAQTRFEAHERYIDWQIILQGREMMAVAPRKGLEVTEAREEDDVWFFADPNEFDSRIVQAGEMAVFYPCDAHRPGLAVQPGEIVFKSVVKIPV